MGLDIVEEKSSEKLAIQTIQNEIQKKENKNCCTEHQWVLRHL